MPIVKPAVVSISSDDEDDGERKFHNGRESGHPVVVLISSDDEDDGERKFEEGLESIHIHDGGYKKSDDHESDKVEQNDVEKTIEGESLVNFDRSEPSSEGGNDLKELSLYECKTYLRKHGIRVSGTKEECIQRIKEHERLKDGKGEVLYPRSSFSIDCTGDACKGDVLLFRQNIYNSQRDIIGRRTVAGRIAKESYGASLQQHTFSVEVLWSKRSKKLEPLSILLVKGRNLYKFGTYRQPWESEADRLKVLREKHERGKAARLARKLREKRCASGDVKGTKLCKNTTAHNLAVRFQKAKFERANQFTYHPHPNHSICSPYNNGQRPNHAFLQLRGLRGHCRDKYIPPIHRLTYENINIVSIFPKSSFSIKCTDDARKGDVVLFKQHVDVQRNKAKNKTIVAGRILKVHHCESKENPKFVIQVLWTKHSSICLRPGSVLLVRSHELYKFGTFRQPWKNEEKRSKLSKPTGKRKLKKSDIDPNKNEGVKPEKVSQKVPSPSKHKSSKREHACESATAVTRVQKRKARKVLKKRLKKLKLLEPGPNPTNSNLNPSPNPNKISSTGSKKGSCPNLKPRHNSNPNTLQNSHPDAHNLNSHQNTCGHCHHQQWSSSFPYGMPNPSPPNQPPVWFSSNQGSSGSGYGGSATPTGGHKRKAAPLQKKKKKKQKKSKHLEPNADTNFNPCVPNPSPDPNMVLTTDSNKGSNRQNSNPNTLQNPNLEPPPKLNPRKKPKRRPNHNPCKDSEPRQTPNPNTLQNPNLEPPQKPNPCKKPKQRPKHNPCKDSEPRQTPNPNPNTPQNPDPNISPDSNLNTHADPNINPHPNSYAYGHHQQASSSSSYDRSMMHNPPPPAGYLINQPPLHPNHHNPCRDSESYQILNPNTLQNPNSHQHPHPNIPPNSNLNPPLNGYVHGHHQPSTSFPYDRSMMPNPPPLPNQGFSGYGGQWGHNQSPGYNNYYTQQLVIQGLIALWYHQQTR